MKLTIGENIRNFRKKNDLTQEAFAERLGVTYQSVSRWENGITYPDLELIPSISEVLSITVDELLGMPQKEQEKRATEAFDELRRECIKRDYNSERIADLLRDIRRNYLNSKDAWRPFCDGNERAFRDPKILPEVRLLAEAYLARHPMHPNTLETMAVIEDEEKIGDFLKRHTPSMDCSARALLFRRYLYRRDAKRLAPERRYKLHQAFSILLDSRCFLGIGEDKSDPDAADEFMEEMLSLIRSDAAPDRPDMWVPYRLELGLKSAAKSLSCGNRGEALVRIEAAVTLLENTMRITDEVMLPTSCRFLDGMVWKTREDYHSLHNDPNAPRERNIFIHSYMDGITDCYAVYPSLWLNILQGKDFETLHDHLEFQKLCERVKSLIIKKPKEN